jgi:hypothetical protein
MAGGPTSGVVLFSLMDLRDAGSPTALALDIGQQGDVGETWVLRCTMIERTQVRNVNSGDGPIHFRRAVILNDDSGFPNRVFRTASTDSLIDYFENITGSPDDGIVDSDGKLTGASRTEWLNKRGHEIDGVFG